MTNAELWELQRRAQHEALHAMLTTHAAGTVEEVHIWPEALTVSRYPLHPSALPYQQRHFPALAWVQTKRILAGILAPSVLMEGEVLAGSDRELVEAWLDAWQQLPAAISARELMTDATQYARAWYKQRHAWVHNVRNALVQRRKLWGNSAWLQVLQSCRPPETRPCRVAVPSRPAAQRQRALNNAIRTEHLLCYDDWRTSRAGSAGLLHQSW
jgi:hypothetical protein